MIMIKRREKLKKKIKYVKKKKLDVQGRSPLLQIREEDNVNELF